MTKVSGCDAERVTYFWMSRRYELSLSEPLALLAASEPPAPASEAVFSGAAGTAVAPSCLPFFLRALFDSPVTRFCSLLTTSGAIAVFNFADFEDLSSVYTWVAYLKWEMNSRLFVVRF